MNRILVTGGHRKGRPPGGISTSVHGRPSQREQVVTIGEVIGRPLRFEEMTPDEARREWPAPPPVVDMLLKAWAAAIGQPALVTSAVEEITGRPARTFRAWVTDHAEEFRA